MSMEKPEFKIGTIVTVDRYNHIDDMEKAPIVGYGEMPISGRLTYKMDIRGTIIESTGGSIVESRLYDPAPEGERHEKRFTTFNF